MDLVLSVFGGLYFLGIFIVILLLIYLIRKRIQSKKTEDFEKRAN